MNNDKIIAEFKNYPELIEKLYIYSSNIEKLKTTDIISAQRAINSINEIIDSMIFEIKEINETMTNLKNQKKIVLILKYFYKIKKYLLEHKYFQTISDINQTYNFLVYEKENPKRSIFRKTTAIAAALLVLVGYGLINTNITMAQPQNIKQEQIVYETVNFNNIIKAFDNLKGNQIKSPYWEKSKILNIDISGYRSSHKNLNNTLIVELTDAGKEKINTNYEKFILQLFNENPNVSYILYIINETGGFRSITIWNSKGWMGNNYFQNESKLNNVLQGVLDSI